jgi:glycosyltransferase involved in cell wall biosynthesis
VDTLIRAAAELGQHSDRLTVTLAGAVTGTKAYIEEVRSLVAELPSSVHVDWRENLPRRESAELLRAHKVCVIPSLWDEPFGLVAIEALATGTPLVATATGGMAEFLDHERNALIFARGDATALAAAVRRVLSDTALATRLRREGLEDAAGFRLVDSLERIRQHLLTSVPSLSRQ